MSAQTGPGRGRPGTNIEELWEQICTFRVTCEATRAQTAASARAASIAHDSYRAGSATSSTSSRPTGRRLPRSSPTSRPYRDARAQLRILTGRFEGGQR